MKNYILFILLLFFTISQGNAQNETITISGQVSDYNGNPIDSARVRLLTSGFQEAYYTHTNKGW